MKTNAKVSTIQKAIVNISNLYDGNILFKKAPHKVGKLNHFTLKTLNANAAGSLVRSDGVKQRKASSEVYDNLMKEIFKLGKPDTIVDNKSALKMDSMNEGEILTPVKRKYTKSINLEGAVKSESRITSLKRKYTKTKAQNLLELNKMLVTITKYLQNHPNLLGASFS